MDKTKPHLMVSSKSGQMTVSKKKADLGVASWIVLLASQLPSLNRLSQEVWYSLKMFPPFILQHGQIGMEVSNVAA